MAKTYPIEDKVNEALTGESKKNALSFAAFLRENDILPDTHEGGGGWSIMRGEESIGFLFINGEKDIPGPWTFWFNSCDFDGMAEADVKETAWKYANTCSHFSSGGTDCGCGDQPGFTRVIFGKEFENRCHSPLMFTNPDEDTLNNLKKLILLLN